jgi:hypothetical protein
MCDYSLHAVASRPAKVGEMLITTSFSGGTRGFAAEGNRTWRPACFRGPNWLLIKM